MTQGSISLHQVDIFDTISYLLKTLVAYSQLQIAENKMAPEFDLNQVPAEIKNSFNKWAEEAAAQGRIRSGHVIRRPDSTEKVKFILVDDEPLIQYADNSFAPVEARLYVGEKIAEELRSIGFDRAEVFSPDQSKAVGE